MKKLVVAFFVLLLAAISYWYFFMNTSENSDEKYVFVEITRGDINTTITSTGTLDAVSTVDVGTQVSGRIDKLNVDFNDRVRKGQLLAVLDTTFLAASLKDAEANLERAKAQYDEAVSKFDVIQKLYDKNMVSEIDFVTAKTSVATTKASMLSSKSALERAETNLKYAFIISPINGTVINRNVEEGQTVAASLQAPVLFIIAEDLSKMEILAQVDESDIGQIKEGQEAKFTVQAYSDKEFSGIVKQIRLQPQTVQNVVNYTVVIQTDNTEGLLLPGMTATIDFYIERKTDVLLVPNIALRFTPSQETMNEYYARMQKKFDEMPDSLKTQGRGRGMFGGMQAGQGMSQRNPGAADKFKAVWILNEDGQLDMKRFFAGSSDGKSTEILRSRDLQEGMKVISEIQSEKKAETNNVPPRMPGLGRGFR